MKMYTAFVSSFILSFISIIVLFVSYFNGFFNILENANDMHQINNPALVFQELFSPTLIISAIIASISSLVYIILGIVMVIKKPNIESLHLILWIIGFLGFGFITAIVFMITSKSMNLRPPYDHMSDNHLN